MDTTVKTNRLSRRTFLAGSALSVASTLSTPSHADDRPADGWIDAHVHVWTPDRGQFPLAKGYDKKDMQPPSFTPSELMKHAEPCRSEARRSYPNELLRPRQCLHAEGHPR